MRGTGITSYIMDNLKHCEHCSEGEYIVRVAKYWHKITPGLVGTLVKIYKRVCEKQENIVHMNELELDHSEYGNFQKLRFHALIAKYRKDGEIVHRSWVITRRGAEFLRSNKQIPDRVRTLLNHVIAHSERLVNLTDVMRSDISWEGYEDFAGQFSEPDENVDDTSTVTKVKKIKGKRYCPNDNTRLKLDIETKEVDGRYIYQGESWLCPNCFYREK